MKPKRLALIGGGQMGRALVGGVLASSVLGEEEICLVEPNEASRQWWASHHPAVDVADLSQAVHSSDAILLAVKPNVISAVTSEAGVSYAGKLVISIAAGISIDRLARLLGHDRVVRVMPNTPSLVMAGASAFCGGSEVTSEDLSWIHQVLDCVGLAVKVTESQMDAVTGLSGSGPAYICLVIEALADGGVQAGLPRGLAMQLATQTVLGTAKMVEVTGKHPGELKDAVASPGGTTIAAIAALEKNGIRGALMQAVLASANRSRELGD